MLLKKINQTINEAAAIENSISISTLNVNKIYAVKYFSELLFVCFKVNMPKISHNSAKF